MHASWRMLDRELFVKEAKPTLHNAEPFMVDVVVVENKSLFTLDAML
jgi:hypothetical protein